MPATVDGLSWPAHLRFPVSRVLVVDPRTDPLWASLSAGPGGSLFTSSPWISAVSDTYGFEPEARVLVDDSGRPEAGLAWTEVRDLRGERRITLPFCDRADPVVTEETWPVVAQDAFAEGAPPFTLRTLDASPAARDPRFTVTGEAAWHTTDLDRSPEDLHAAFRSQTRRNIAKAERSGVQVVLSPEREAVAEYHRLHVELRKRKYRLLAQPLEFFDRIWKAFAPTDSIRTGLALVDGQPVAGAVYLVWQDVVYYKFGASRSEFLPLRPNDALHWTLMQWAQDRGLRSLDWGLSDLDQPGLVDYKRKWATAEGRIRTLNHGGGPRGSRPGVGDALATMTHLFTDPSVPDAVTARAGAAFYRLFC